jgi:arginase
VSRLTLISVPFHLGVRAVGMGGGPLELLRDEALPSRLRSARHDVELVEIAEPSEQHEIGRIFAINRELAGVVGGTLRGGRRPLVVSGNCNVCLGSIGGIDAPRVGIVWLDAHPDFHTPETTDSGFLDGMGLATATGACWHTLAGSIPGRIRDRRRPRSDSRSRGASADPRGIVYGLQPGPRPRSSIQRDGGGRDRSSGEGNRRVSD